MRAAFIILEGGRKQRLPDSVAHMERITWPLAMPQVEPGGRTNFRPDWYNRYEIAPAPAPYVFVKEPNTIADVPAEVIDSLLKK
jgi:hypothetical protein